MTRPRVMVVDDEPALLDLYETWLGELDVSVVRAGCGSEALAAYDDTIDAMVVDRHMPRVSGDEVLAELRERERTPPIAFVSAATPDVGIVDLDIDAYLTKPVSRQEYVDLVESLLRRDTVCEEVACYLADLSKRAALLEAESLSVLRTNPTYAALETDLVRQASTLPRQVADDPFVRQALPDGGAGDPSGTFDPTA